MAKKLSDDFLTTNYPKPLFHKPYNPILTTKKA
nr:MAG TPA: hypothetical protein [Caudoviricetes sp.]